MFGSNRSTVAHQAWFGLAIAIAIVTVWTISLWVLLSLDLARISIAFIVLAMFWQTFLYTGLFVAAHDTMHDAVCPDYPRLNQCLGIVALLLYGLLPYQKLCQMHHQHHHHPASPFDPDYHDGRHRHVITWYLSFIRSHSNRWSILGLVGLYLLAHFLRQVPITNLLFFGIIPSLLSSFQLFYFGTFLPHREPPGGYTNAYRAQTIERPLIWSLISCYHFGYHYEHHQYPGIPWWLLPATKLARSVAVKQEAIRSSSRSD